MRILRRALLAEDRRAWTRGPTRCIADNLSLNHYRGSAFELQFAHVRIDEHERLLGENHAIGQLEIGDLSL